MKQRSLVQSISLVLAPLIIGLGIGWLIGLSASPILSSVLAVVLGLVGSAVAALGGTAQTPQANDSQTDSSGSFPRIAINPWPLAMLVIGIVIGSGFGITARNDAWFGSDLSSEIHRWTTASQLENESGLSTADMTYILLESQYPGANADLLLRNIRDSSGSRIQKEVDFWVGLGLDEAVVVSTLFQSMYGPDQPGSGLQASASAGPNEQFDTILFSNAAAEACDSFAGASGDRLRIALRSSAVTALQKLPELISDDEDLGQIVEKVICASPE